MCCALYKDLTPGGGGGAHSAETLRFAKCSAQHSSRRVAAQWSGATELVPLFEQ